jgi:prepilin-type N-terminal cleavage/methylation domain-containing protein/prepilin-type processing-associated H-X9-DG protein
MRRGFSLLELVVVVGVIAALFALLLPAVQSARESSRFLACKANVRELSLAMHSFASARGSFPPGQLIDNNYLSSTYPSFSNQQMLGHIGYVLGYIEQQPLADRLAELRWGVDQFDTPWTKTLHRDVILHTNIPTLRCPSDALVQAPGWILSLYDSHFIPEEGDARAGWTNYLGSRGYDGRKLDSGIFYARSRIRTKDITDGLSNTLFIGEVAPEDRPVGDKSLAGREDMRHSFMCNAQSVDFGLFDQPPADNQNTSWHMFRSNHNKVANFSMADGSVRSIASAVDLKLVLALATRDSGEVENGN